MCSATSARSRSWRSELFRSASLSRRNVHGPRPNQSPSCLTMLISDREKNEYDLVDKLCLILGSSPDSGTIESLENLFQANSSWTNINLLSKDIRDRGTDLLAQALCKNTTVKKLDLSGNRIDSYSVKFLASAIRENHALTELSLDNNLVSSEGAEALADAIAANASLTSISLVLNELGNRGIKAVAEALSVNNTLRILNLCATAFTLDGAEFLGQALKVNTAITSLNVMNNGIGQDGAAALADALQVNRTLTEINLGRCGLGKWGVGALLQALKINSTIKRIILHGNQLGDIGLEAIARALQVNSSLESIDLANNEITDEGAMVLADALRVNSTLSHVCFSKNKATEIGMWSLLKAIMWKKNALHVRVDKNITGDLGILFKVGTIQPVTNEHGVVAKDMYDLSSVDTTGKHWLYHNVQAVLQQHETNGAQIVDLTNISRTNSDGSYCAVAAAMQNDVDKTLQCLRLWPERAGEVLVERYGNRFAVLKRGIMYDVIQKERIVKHDFGLSLKKGLLYDMHHAIRKENAAQGTPSRSGTEASKAAVAVAWAITSTSALSMVNIHLCGEGYAGKTMTRQALLRTLGCGTIGRLMLPSRLADIALEAGRTLGMVSEAVEFKGNNGAPVRVLLHDYGGQLEFRANHAPHLSAANSVYVVVVPLWDKRPGHDRAYELEEIVAMYTQWLKFLYTVVPTAVVATEIPSEEASSPVEASAPVLSQCLTIINFARWCSAEVTQLVEQRLIEVLDTFNAAPDNHRLHFIEKPIVLDSNTPAEVHRLLAPVLKQVIEKLSTAPIPIAPCLQTVLADKALNNEWSLFTTESQLKGLIRSAIQDKNLFARVRTAITNEATREKVLDTISEITQGMLESRRDVVVFPVHTGERISINRPNWLTNELLGSLFDPKVRPQLMKAAAMRRVEEGAEDSHLLSLQDINAAVKNKLDTMTHAMIDDSFIPKLLQHVGVCIPVVVDEGGLVRAVAEGADASAVQHWFPAFSTIAMKETDGALLRGAEHVIARQFKLVDPEFCIFPPGYFASLFVSIVSLYNTTNHIQIFNNGMVLSSGSDRFQIVVRQTADEKSFVVTVATVGSEPGSDLAFQTIQDIKKFIFSESDWRGNVRVQEWCLHPRWLLTGTCLHVDKVVERLRDPKQREEHLAFYFGLERGQPLILQTILGELLSVSKAVKQIAQALETFHQEFSAARTALVAQLQDQQEVALEAIHDLAEALETSINHAEDVGAANSQDLTKILDLVASLSGNQVGAGSDAQVLVSAALEAPLQQMRSALASAGDCTSEQLQSLKAEIISEVQQMSAEMHRVVEDKLLAADQARTAAVQETLRDLMKTELQSFITSSGDEESRAIAAAQVAALLQKLDDSASRQEELWEEIVALRSSVQVVRSVQTDTAYGVYDTPLLLSITQPAATGLTGSLKRTLYEVYRLHFVCPCCGKKAASGPKGHGYKLKVTKAWVTRMSKVLRCTLLALQVLSLLTPVPLPHLADLAQYLPGDLGTEDWSDLLGAANKSLSQATGPQLDLQLSSPTINATPAPVSAQRPVITLEHVTSVLEVLQMAGEAPSPAHPTHTGLTRAICSSKGQCAWVCQQGEDGQDSACKTRYMAEGNDCLAIQMVLR